VKRYVRVPNARDVPQHAEWLGEPSAAEAEVVLLDAAPWHGGKPTAERARVTQLASQAGGLPALLAPVEPSKIVCVGRNYRAHAAELSHPVPTEPLFFFKPPSSVLDPNGSVELPPESERVDHEAELALVIGKRGRRISRENALEHVLGYSVACDVTARDLQTKDGQWARAKGFDGFCPVGPFLTTDVDPATLEIRLWVGGALRQDGKTRDMVFDVPTLVAAASAFLTLEPGDLILTGTPEGVGPLKAGERVELEITGLGRLGFGVRSFEPGATSK
jgi:2-keto-4-pentenoate hydratase/2-oxohepta-3-ene-1,7-dioic acid hydratase in catechol pathway